jgi:hypothetical protein
MKSQSFLSSDRLGFKECYLFQACFANWVLLFCIHRQQDSIRVEILFSKEIYVSFWQDDSIGLEILLSAEASVRY